MNNLDYAARQKARRDAARAAGLCLVCCRREREPNLSTCPHCTALKRARNDRHPADEMRVRVKRSAADRFHVCCQAHGAHRAGCSEAT